jgi:hypothetical protein
MVTKIRMFEQLCCCENCEKLCVVKDRMTAEQRLEMKCSNFLLKNSYVKPNETQEILDFVLARIKTIQGTTMQGPYTKDEVKHIMKTMHDRGEL